MPSLPPAPATPTFPLQDLLRVEPPVTPGDFVEFWRTRYEKTLNHSPQPRLIDSGKDLAGLRLFDFSFKSTDKVTINGWALIPQKDPVERAFIIGHGYGGRDAPDLHLKLTRAALFFPCLRGISRSPHPPVSADPWWHVLHDIDKPHRYIHGGCVEDIWLTVSSALRFFPHTGGRLAYLGISFGGGIGVLATAPDKRISAAHFNVPSFGHHPLRLSLPSFGSAASVQKFYQKHQQATLRTLQYYDAASAARTIHIPTHFALALRDPSVTPVGQFAIYNSVPGKKKLFVLPAGHDDYEKKASIERQLVREIGQFFDSL